MSKSQRRAVFVARLCIFKLNNVHTTKILFLLFSLAPASVEPLNKKLIEKGDSFTLFCKVSGLPAPTVVWTQVSTGLTHHNKTWVITDFKLGEYRCDASNMCGNDSDTMFVSLLGKSMQCFNYRGVPKEK